MWRYCSVNACGIRNGIEKRVVEWGRNSFLFVEIENSGRGGARGRTHSEPVLRHAFFWLRQGWLLGTCQGQESSGCRRNGRRASRAFPRQVRHGCTARHSPRAFESCRRASTLWAWYPFLRILLVWKDASENTSKKGGCTRLQRTPMNMQTA